MRRPFGTKLGANTLPIGPRKNPLIDWGRWETERQDESFIHGVNWQIAQGLGVVSGPSN